MNEADFLQKQIRIIERYLRFFNISKEDEQRVILKFIEIHAKKIRGKQEMKYFKMSEFACPCCGQAAMDLSFIKRLDDARHFAGIPFIITSGYRCKQHNEQIGGSENSSHKKGLAVDLKCEYSEHRFKMIQSLIAMGFNRIGIRKDFIHVDFDTSKDQKVMWIYA